MSASDYTDYVRVIPRDLFNEAGLGKAMGRVYILLEEHCVEDAQLLPEQVSSFDIKQDQSSGNIRVVNIQFKVGDQEWYLERPLNTRASWSLLARLPDYSEEIEVFNEDGSFTDDMRRLIGLDSYTPGTGF
jgi:hypothetical protein